MADSTNKAGVSNTASATNIAGASNTAGASNMAGATNMASVSNMTGASKTEGYSAKAQRRIDGILDVAEQLFVAKGYEHTTINDILQASGVAKGSLYYYFKSKEDVLDGIIRRRSDRYLEAAEAIAAEPGLAAPEKLLRLLLTMQPADEQSEQLIADLESSSNGQMFVKSLAEMVLRFAPIAARVIEQGVAEGAFETDFALESAEIILAAAHALFDNSLLAWTDEQRTARLVALISASERMLGAKPGTVLGLALELFG